MQTSRLKLQFSMQNIQEGWLNKNFHVKWELGPFLSLFSWMDLDQPCDRVLTNFLPKTATSSEKLHSCSHLPGKFPFNQHSGMTTKVVMAAAFGAEPATDLTAAKMVIMSIQHQSGAASSSKMLRTSASGGQKRSNMKADQKTPSIAHFFQKQR